MGIIASEVKQEILSRVKAGEKVKDLATQYGLSDRTIYLWLKVGATSQVSILEFNKLKKENQMLKEIVGVLNLELLKTKKGGRLDR